MTVIKINIQTFTVSGKVKHCSAERARRRNGENGWDGWDKGELCKEVRCHHILINLYLGGAGTAFMERSIGNGLGAIHVCECVTHGLSLAAILLAACSPWSTFICTIWCDEIFSLLELSLMRRVAVCCVGYISIPGRCSHSHMHPLSAPEVMISATSLPTAPSVRVRQRFFCLFIVLAYCMHIWHAPVGT